MRVVDVQWLGLGLSGVLGLGTSSLDERWDIDERECFRRAVIDCLRRHFYVTSAY